MPGGLFISKSSTSHLEAAIENEGACSFSLPHVSEFLTWQRFVRCPLISRRGAHVPESPRGLLLGLSISQVPAWRSQAGKGLLGTVLTPLVWAAPGLSTTSPDAAVFAHYLSHKAAAYGVLAFSAGKVGWVMAVWCRNLPVLRAGGQMFPSLIAK